ncbi:MAG: site-specific integrase, partial [Gemmataceae bacterium]|nr:site-specific integrase [Gemmataceae bacterium]
RVVLMARTPKPWFRTERAVWCVHFRGQMHQLGAHPDGFPPPKQVKGRWNAPPPILQAFHALLAVPEAAPPPKTVTTVPDVFDAYLEWCQKHRTPRTYEWSRSHIQDFLDSLADKRMPVDSLKPFHVQQWVDAKTSWGPNHTRGGIAAVQRAFNWAVKLGHLAKSPIAHIDKPAPVRREQVLTRKEFDALLGHVRDESFRDVLEFCWETGARVQEVRLIEADHYKPDRGRIELPPPEAKGKKRWRLIYLTDRAEEIVRRRAARPDGPIFRNIDGNPWNAQNFNNRFCRLQKKLGVKYALTAFRHSFCQRLLEAGVDHTTVAALMGHANAVMVSTTYSHMDQAKDFLREELTRASRGGKSG